MSSDKKERQRAVVLFCSFDSQNDIWTRGDFFVKADWFCIDSARMHRFPLLVVDKRCNMLIIAIWDKLGYNYKVD